MGHWLLTDTLRAGRTPPPALFPFLSEDRQDPFRRGRGDPRHIVLRLEATADGCRWLLDQWARLGRRLERGRDWRTNELIVALHLRGQRPLGADLLEWGGLLESTPADGEPEVIAQARRALLLQLDEGVPGDPAGQRAALRRLVREEAERLQRRKAGSRAARGGRPGRAGRPAGGGHDGGRGADAAVPARFRSQAAPGAQHPAEAPPGRGCRRRRRSGARRRPRARAGAGGNGRTPERSGGRPGGRGRRRGPARGRKATAWRMTTRWPAGPRGVAPGWSLSPLRGRSWWRPARSLIPSRETNPRPRPPATPSRNDRPAGPRRSDGPPAAGGTDPAKRTQPIGRRRSQSHKTNPPGRGGSPIRVARP